MPDSPEPRDLVSLHHHFEAQLTALEKQLTIRLDAMDRAMELARAEIDMRLGKLNELRAEVMTDRALFLPRELFETYIRESRTRHEKIDTSLTTIETRAATWVGVIGFLFLALNVVIHLWK